MSLFAAVEMAPRDPILGLNEQFNADTRPNKVNLGVGVYFDENGKLPLLACVATAEAQLVAAAKPRGYLPIDGIAAYDKAVQSWSSVPTAPPSRPAAWPPCRPWAAPAA
jgi:aromatic-amino-acid transaminase